MSDDRIDAAIAAGITAAAEKYADGNRDQGMFVTFTASDGYPSFRGATAAEVAEVAVRAAAPALTAAGFAKGQRRATVTEAALAATERTLDRIASEAASDSIRLCADAHHPVDAGNYPGPIHCLAHSQGHACVTAMYARVPDSTFTADERIARDGDV